MTITNARHTSFSVMDMQESLAFYRDLLGSEVVSERPAVTDIYFREIVGIPDAVVYVVLLRILGTDYLLELLEYKHPRGVAQNLSPNNPGSSHIAYIVDDLLAMVPDLVEAGVEFISEPVALDAGPSSGGWPLYMKDPNGIVVELFQPSSD